MGHYLNKIMINFQKNNIKNIFQNNKDYNL